VRYLAVLAAINECYSIFVSIEREQDPPTGIRPGLPTVSDFRKTGESGGGRPHHKL
jgi:hypothetical protein